MNVLPLVTVFVPVYNAERYISETIRSVLSQTYVNFELLLIDDGSKDGSAAIIQSFDDPRIRYLRNVTNKGISFTRNRGIAEARGEFMALLDADDIALPHRLQNQIEYFQRHPEMAMCGSHARLIDAAGIATGKVYLMPTDPAEISARLFFHNTFINSSVMFRMEALRASSGYYEGFSEDYEMAIQLNGRFVLGNVNDVLVLYRIHGANSTIQDSNRYREAEYQLLARMQRAIGLPGDDQEVAVHHSLRLGGDSTAFDIGDYYKLLNAIWYANDKMRKYPKASFKKFIFELWYEKIREKAKRRAFFVVFASPLFSWRLMTFKMFRKTFKQTFWMER
ncbi:glycosyltransferase family 2 protein [Parapedobacter koreensis]|uniref:Glycosyltransferase involved in cell wall bisynthesis n=1 Tax=Parapedobacter koreensis TaxID=332977 RepID=A0A1H7GCQ4_9SPHI|nr:glycosyltransferase [Parapedobacter koreensis]SEK35888.1 Glycosyltransferase involved in cell wall bisynthesis [Parapedobacter koreensis]